MTEAGHLDGDLDRLLDAPVLTRENTGGGFFTTLAIPRPRPGETLHLGEQVWVGIEGLEFGLGMILHLYGDRQPPLEGYAVGIEYTSPSDFEQARFTIIPEPGPSRASGNWQPISDIPERSTRWDRLDGFDVWLVAGFLLLDPVSGTFVDDCMSVDCAPSLEVRLIALAITTLAVAGIPALAIAAVIKRLLASSAQ